MGNKKNLAPKINYHYNNPRKWSQPLQKKWEERSDNALVKPRGTLKNLGLGVS
jgi:hypothetical protein